MTLTVSSGAGTVSGCAYNDSLVVAFGRLQSDRDARCAHARATDGSLTPATTAGFTVAGTAAHLAFTQQPGNSNGAFPSQPVVVVEDS